MSKNPYTALSLPFFLIGLVVASQALVRHHKARASLHWPVTGGAVGWANVDERKSIDGGVKYTPHVEFHYEVDGMPYDATTYTFGRKTTPNGGFAHGLVKTYTLRPAVDVYYNPKHPEEAVLRPGDTSGLLMQGVVGGVFVAVGMFAIWHGRGWRRMSMGMR